MTRTSSTPSVHPAPAERSATPDSSVVALTERVLRRVGDDPSFLGSALTAYQRCAGADVGGIAAFLGCPVAALPHLALARRPDPHRPRFRDELARLAARSGAAEGRLAAVLQFWHRGGC